jgi:hypothetical protein
MRSTSGNNGLHSDPKHCAKWDRDPGGGEGTTATFTFKNYQLLKIISESVKKARPSLRVR